jgi:hypothetical protein
LGERDRGREQRGDDDEATHSPCSIGRSLAGFAGFTSGFGFFTAGLIGGFGAGVVVVFGTGVGAGVGAGAGTGGGATGAGVGAGVGIGSGAGAAAAGILDGGCGDAEPETPIAIPAIAAAPTRPIATNRPTRDFAPPTIDWLAAPLSVVG